MINTITLDTNKLYEYIKEQNEMIEHLKYRLNKIKQVVDDNTYIDLETNKKFIDVIKIKEVI